MTNEPEKPFDFDEKTGHVIQKGSLRPDGTRRRDRTVKIASAVEQRFPGSSTQSFKNEEQTKNQGTQTEGWFPKQKYVAPHLRDEDYEKMKKSMNDLKITIVNDQCQRREKLLSYLNSEIGDYKCICKRRETVLVCANCEFFAMGRILKICRTHPLEFKPTDLSHCPDCSSHQLHLVENPSKDEIEKATAKKEPKAELKSAKMEPKAPLRRPFSPVEKSEGSKGFFKEEVFKKDPIKIGSKEEPIVKPKNVTKKRVSFAEDDTNNCKDENNKIVPISISFGMNGETVQNEDQGVQILSQKDKYVQIKDKSAQSTENVVKSWRDWGDYAICVLQTIDEKLEKLHKAREERMLKVENLLKTIKIPPEIDEKVESWFAGDTWCRPVDYDDEVVIENPYKPRNFDMKTCICNRGLSFVVCGFCGFGKIDARMKVACTLHPNVTNENDICPCPGCQYAGFLTELIRHGKA